MSVPDYGEPWTYDAGAEEMLDCTGHPIGDRIPHGVNPLLWQKEIGNMIAARVNACAGLNPTKLREQRDRLLAMCDELAGRLAGYSTFTEWTENDDDVLDRGLALLRELQPNPAPAASAVRVSPRPSPTAGALELEPGEDVP